MYLVKYYIFVCLLLLYVTATTGQIDGCFHETFDDIESSEIYIECVGAGASKWTFDTYSENAEQPTPPTSNGFIKADGEEHCVASDFVLNAVDGSKVHVTYFATHDSHIDFLFLNPTEESEGVVVSVPVTYNRWTTSSFDLEAGEYKFFIVATIVEGGSVIIDSITYVDDPGEIDACTFIDTDSDDENENGFNWQILIIVASVIGGLIFLCLFAVLLFFWGKHSIKTSVEPISDLEKTVPHIPRAHFRADRVA